MTHMHPTKATTADQSIERNSLMQRPRRTRTHLLGVLVLLSSTVLAATSTVVDVPRAWRAGRALELRHVTAHAIFCHTPLWFDVAKPGALDLS